MVSVFLLVRYLREDGDDGLGPVVEAGAARGTTVDVRDLFGVVKSDRRLSIEDMNEIIRRGWAGQATEAAAQQDGES